MTREQKFFNALRDVFVGAKVEGESGYINLMQIKSRYYEKGVFPKLQQDMLEALKVDTEKNKIEVDLSKLYSGIDIAETLSNLTGKWIKRINADPSNPLSAGSVEFEDGEVVGTENLDWKRIKPLIWW